MIKTGGWSLLQSAANPSLEHTVEKDAPGREQGDGARYEEVFMRVYGRDYADRLKRAGFALTVSDFVRDLPAEVRRKLGLDPEETIYFCRKPADRLQPIGSRTGGEDRPTESASPDARADSNS